MPLLKRPSASPPEAASPAAPSIDNAPGDENTGLEALARAIDKAGMGVPVSLALHATKPLAWLGGQMLWALQPFFGGLWRRPGAGYDTLARLLENEERVDELIERLGAGRSR